MSTPLPPELYSQLTSALSPPPPITLELDILPSSYSPHLHFSPETALALPKPLLISLFLNARKIFFAHLGSPADNSYDAALTATLVLLFWEPNHTTAANFRKRHLRELRRRWRAGGGGIGELDEAVQKELCFVASLVTSPLIRHAKSSTLWAHRLWIIKTFLERIIAPKGIDKESQGKRLVRFWEEELVVVMKAGERHPRNYYAWNYARQLYSIILGRSETAGVQLMNKSLVKMKKWCLEHPRDISGWAFLAFLLERTEKGGVSGGDADLVDKDKRGRVVQETKAFVRMFEWRGESVGWFLKTMG